MLIKVVGSAAGGGLPQINCNCRNCADARRGNPAVRVRTQSSLAVSGDGRHWTLLNASPDLRQQIAATPQLWPSLDAGRRSSPIGSIILTSADVDHIAGLLSLREGVAFTLYASASVHEALRANPIYNGLAPAPVGCRDAPLGSAFAIAGGLSVEAFVVPGKVALSLENAATLAGSRSGDPVGLKISDPRRGAAFHYIPG